MKPGLGKPQGANQSKVTLALGLEELSWPVEMHVPSLSL